MKSDVLHTAWCNISGAAAGEILHWSLLGGKGLNYIGNCKLTTILDKTCWHMLKKGTFPPNFLNKSRLLWNKVSVAPLPPEQCCNKRFPYSTEKFRWQWAQHATPNQHCPGERGFVSTVLSKIVVTTLVTAGKVSGCQSNHFGHIGDCSGRHFKHCN